MDMRLIAGVARLHRWQQTGTPVRDMLGKVAVPRYNTHARKGETLFACQQGHLKTNVHDTVLTLRDQPCAAQG